MRRERRSGSCAARRLDRIERSDYRAFRFAQISLVDQMLAHRIPHQLGAVAYAELGEHAAAMVFGGLRADLEPLRDLLDREPVDDEVQHLALARGQRAVWIGR